MESIVFKVAKFLLRYLQEIKNKSSYVDVVFNQFLKLFEAIVYSTTQSSALTSVFIQLQFLGLFFKWVVGGWVQY